MIEVAALTYGMLATFVMSSASRNRQAARRNPAILVAFGRMLMAFSATLSLGLLGCAGLAASGASPIPAAIA